MRFSAIALAAVAASAANAQRPKDTPICDYYTTALLKDNTAENQKTLLTLLVNTVVIGNYTMPNVGVKVAGILADGEVDGEKVSLLPYFNGELASTNRNNKPTCVNFLDGGAAEPLKKNKPADDEKSHQYFLLTHLYQFFGALLGCSKQGNPAFAAYAANPSMYKVHKFMDLGNAEVTYFIQQVGLAAASFGVAKDDVEAVGKSLAGAFGMRCSPPAEVIPGQGPQLQAICIAHDCPVAAKDAKCDAYDKAEHPAKCNATSSMTSGSGSSGMGGDMSSTSLASMSGMPTGSGSMTPMPEVSGSGSMNTMPAGSESTSGAGPAATVPTSSSATKANGVNFGLVAALVAAVAAYAL